MSTFSRLIRLAGAILAQGKDPVAIFEGLVKTFTDQKLIASARDAAAKLEALPAELKADFDTAITQLEKDFNVPLA